MDTILIDHEGKWYSSKNAKYDAHGNVVAKHSHIRYRATVVIIRDGKVLLVRDRGEKDYSLPGGGFKRHENTIQAGTREVREELGIVSISAKRLRYCDFQGRRAKHKVCQLVIEVEPYINQPKEIDKVIWWDMKSDLNVQGHVKYILSKLGEHE